MAVIPDETLLARRPETDGEERPRWHGHQLNRPAFYRAIASIGGGLPRPWRLGLAAAVAPRVRRLFKAEWPVRFVPRRRPTDVLGLLAALRRGEVVAMQGARAIGTRGDVVVSFFGAPACFPLGPFALARAADAPVLPAFCVLDRDRRYTVWLREPIAVGAGAEAAAHARWVTTLEDMVRAHPEQWFNFVDFWRTSRGA